MVNFSLFDSYTLAENLIKNTIQHVLTNNEKDLKNLSRDVNDLQKVVENPWIFISYEAAKKITQKNEEGLSTEEERFLTVRST